MDVWWTKIFPILFGNESETLGLIEPLNRSFHHAKSSFIALKSYDTAIKKLHKAHSFCGSQYGKNVNFAPIISHNCFRVKREVQKKPKPSARSKRGWLPLVPFEEHMIQAQFPAAADVF